MANKHTITVTSCGRSITFLLANVATVDRYGVGIVVSDEDGDEIVSTEHEDEAEAVLVEKQILDAWDEWLESE